MMQPFNNATATALHAAAYPIKIEDKHKVQLDATAHKHDSMQLILSK
jgi:hypothetical protein